MDSAFKDKLFTSFNELQNAIQEYEEKNCVQLYKRHLGSEYLLDQNSLLLQDCSPYSCSSYNNINTYRPKNQTISSIYIQTSSCIQRSVEVLILSEHNHSLEFTTSNYSSMPSSQHV
jgi:uncharacterized protein with NRDE domain